MSVALRLYAQLTEAGEYKIRAHLSNSRTDGTFRVENGFHLHANHHRNITKLFYCGCNIQSHPFYLTLVNS
jgi:hypothetical protein